MLSIDERMEERMTEVPHDQLRGRESFGTSNGNCLSGSDEASCLGRQRKLFEALQMLIVMMED